MKAWITATVLLAAAVMAFITPKDKFDYYILSLSWTPSWSAEAGDARGAAQCEAGRGYGFTLHGLWPQYERGGRRKRGGSGHARPSDIEAAFLSANPGLGPDQITVTCKSGRIQEVRICLTKDLRWRDCATDTRRDCTVSGAGFQPVR